MIYMWHFVAGIHLFFKSKKIEMYFKVFCSLLSRLQSQQLFEDPISEKTTNQKICNKATYNTWRKCTVRSYSGTIFVEQEG